MARCLSGKEARVLVVRSSACSCACSCACWCRGGRRRGRATKVMPRAAILFHVLYEALFAGAHGGGALILADAVGCARRTLTPRGSIPATDPLRSSGDGAKRALVVSTPLAGYLARCRRASTGTDRVVVRSLPRAPRLARKVAQIARHDDRWSFRPPQVAVAFARAAEAGSGFSSISHLPSRRFRLLPTERP